MRCLVVFCAALVLVCTTQAGAANSSWPITSVYDGDTFMVEIPALPVELRKVSIRLRGIDTPEIGARAKCHAEKKMGERARNYLRYLLSRGDVRFEDLGWDKYGGRVDARVLVDGVDVSESLILSGLARRYDGKGARQGWC